jgi:hypothetical protein
MSKITRTSGIQGAVRRAIAQRDKALNGNMVLVVTPATTGSSAAAVAAAIAGDAHKFTRTVQIALRDAQGNDHDWFDGTMAIAASKTGSGVVAIKDAASTAQFADGKATVDLEHTGTWSAGANQVETLTALVDGAGDVVTTAGNASLVVTCTGMTGSPKTITFALAAGDDAADVAGKARTALAGTAAVTALFDVSGESDDVVLTRKARVANIANLAMVLDDGTSVGLAQATSVDTTAGAAPDTATLTVTGATIMGYTIADKTSVDTLVD